MIAVSNESFNFSLHVIILKLSEDVNIIVFDPFMSQLFCIKKILKNVNF